MGPLRPGRPHGGTVDAAATAQRPELFTGRRSLRVKGERAALRACILLAPVTIGLIGLIFKSVSVADMILLIIAGMVYVSLSRGRLLGSSIRIHERQLPEVHGIVESVAQRLGIEPPQIFVRDDPFVPIAAVGIGSPYALILSSQYLEHLRPGELRFLVARELAHIAAGHTRFMSMLSISGRENAAVALVFGAWLRRAEYTADRVGLLCAESLVDAVAAISITTFHAIGRRIDLQQLAEQRREIEAEPTLRVGQWTSGMPYAVNRIAELGTFAYGELARFWRDELERPRERPVVAATAAELAAANTRVVRRDCAPSWRRALAFGVDFLLISLIVSSLFAANVSSDSEATRTVHDTAPAIMRFLEQHGAVLTFSTQSGVVLLVFCIYASILVALSGQTLGMMVAELRVVTTHFGNAGVARTLWRYSVAGIILVALPVALLGLILRIHVHDRVSGTRVVRSRAESATVPARAA